MNVRVLLVVGSVGLFFGCKSAPSAPETVVDSPNIIYILADDLGYGDVGAYGQQKIETPNIDALAAQGMKFTQHYSGSPVCAPSRCVLLTGKHTGNAYIRGNGEWRERGEVWDFVAMLEDSTLEGQRPLPADTPTLPKLLKQAGYATGMIGKWGLGAPHTKSIPTTMGFDYFYGYNCQRQAHTYYPVHLYENERRVYLRNDTVPPRARMPEGADPYNLASYADFTLTDYTPDLMFEKLMQFVNKQRAEPFFMYWATPIPHVPLQAPQRWVDYYVEKFGDEQPYLSERSYFPHRYPRAAYAAMVSYLDEQVGQLVSLLKELGEYENTLIIFTSDNGPSFNGGTDSPWFDSGGPFSSEKGRGKGSVYEGGIRVPMIASWPERIAAGSTTDHLSAFYDVLPTLAEVAGVDELPATDGVSFLPVLLSQDNQPKHDFLYWEFPQYGGQVAVRMDEWKFIQRELNSEEPTLELYNLSEDLAETNNVADSHPDVVQKAQSIINQAHTEPTLENFKIPTLEAGL
ncbi:arylsulfatase [Tunicatimonas pelagia]|uniref:arylsulfatase n=1 Tax=Tunicatimonas pelagia TaxID=931531 RepID=UPI0026654EDC|nr:arylsulfatase [Tunicatimonas pelagia]WKN42791.1 arylsulfatase [Tunicatimonas pelagia]